MRIRLALTAIAAATVLGACAPVAGAPEATIPAAMAGRWGMNEADCTTTRGDDKGLLVMGETTLRFYESVAQLSRVHERTASSLVGDFDFTGEGQSWTRRVALDLRDGGMTLVRREHDTGAASGPYRYAACP